MKHTGLGKHPKNYVIYIEKGEKINESIEAFCISHNIVHASYTGIGAITNVEIARYNSATKSYISKSFSDEYELISLVGNFGYIKNNDDKDRGFAHTHISFSNNDFQCYGGHLNEGEILAVGEIYITAYSKALIRSFDEHIGLNTMNISCNHGANEICACGCDDRSSNEHPLSSV